MFPVATPSVVLTASREELTALLVLLQNLQSAEAPLQSLAPKLLGLQQRLEQICHPHQVV